MRTWRAQSRPPWARSCRRARGLRRATRPRWPTPPPVKPGRRARLRGHLQLRGCSSRVRSGVWESKPVTFRLSRATGVHACECGTSGDGCGGVRSCWGSAGGCALLKNLREVLQLQEDAAQTHQPVQWARMPAAVVDRLSPCAKRGLHAPSIGQTQLAGVLRCSKVNSEGLHGRSLHQCSVLAGSAQAGHQHDWDVALSAAAPTEVAIDDGSGAVVARRVIASDNSCLFNAVGYVMEGSRSKAAELRWAAHAPARNYLWGLGLPQAT